MGGVCFSVWLFGRWKQVLCIYSGSLTNALRDVQYILNILSAAYSKHPRCGMFSIYHFNRSRLFACILRSTKQARIKSGQFSCLFHVEYYRLYDSYMLLVGGFHLVDRRQLEPD